MEQLVIDESVQVFIRGEEEDELRNKYPRFKGGSFFSIDCIENYELIRDLCSFGSDLLVLSPLVIKEKIICRINNILQEYKEIE